MIDTHFSIAIPINENECSGLVGHNGDVQFPIIPRSLSACDFKEGEVCCEHESNGDLL